MRSQWGNRRIWQFLGLMAFIPTYIFLRFALPDKRGGQRLVARQKINTPSSFHPPPGFDNVGTVYLENTTSTGLGRVSGRSQRSTVKGGRSCEGGLLYVYEMPAKFNEDIVRSCSDFNQEFCERLSNRGLGVPLESDGHEDRVEIEKLFGDVSSWFNTQTYTPEVTYHARVLQHPCRTANADEASVFYIPYYAALAQERIRAHDNATLANVLPDEMVQWISNFPYATRNGGHDHFMMLGSEHFKFRNNHSTTWGASSLLLRPLLQNMTKLSFDRDLWDGTMAGVPYQTFFHPSNDQQLHKWQNRLHTAKRRHLVSFVGSSKRSWNSPDFTFRTLLMKQCQDWEECVMFDCHDVTARGRGICYYPVAPLHVYLDSHFCLQPKGDSPPRKSIFDSMVGGCIPVFFSQDSAYNQYFWYLPKEREMYSVFIDMKEMERGNMSIKEVLSQYSPERIQTMRNVVINNILPHVTVANPLNYKMTQTPDAVDRAVEGMLVKVARYKAGLEHFFPSPWNTEHDLDKSYDNIAPIHIS